MVSLLTLGFGLPIHQAVGTALASMLVVSISGTVSHYREGNINVPVGVTVGVFGMIGAVFGADIGQAIPEHTLQIAAGFALWILSLLVWLRMHMMSRATSSGYDPSEPSHTGAHIAGAAGLGISGGLAAAFFGVGMTPFIQLGMFSVFRLSLVRTIGTTMLALVFISLSGSAALARHGDVSFEHLVGVTIGMTAGSYVGAKLTGRAPANVLRIAVVATPFVAGTLLLFG
jgi:uncharacterized membrane protein YfcA